MVVALIPTLGWALPLDWTNPSTNSVTVSWQQWTNGQALRYSVYWTPQTNSDTGTNWVTTTNWNTACDVNSSTLSAVLATTNVPIGSRITYVITIPGGLRTAPIVPMIFTNYNGITITNQPAYPN